MDNNDLKRYDLIQRLKKGTVLTMEEVAIVARYNNEQLDKKKTTFDLIEFICIFILITTGLVIIASFIKPAQAPTNPYSNCAKCHNRMMAMVQYFERSGNKHPEMMAEAVLATKRPKLIAAIATKGEKNTPYTARKTGWKNRHNGAWQVNPDYWGTVPKTPIGQALQVDDILDELLDKKTPKKALALYGGDSTDEYWRTVSAEIEEVP